MRIVAWMAAALALAGLARAEVSAADEAERMFAAIGGRAAWAAVNGTINDSQQNLAGPPGQVRVVIAMDFARPRFRIDTTGADFSTTRVIDGERSWRRTRDGAIEPVPADLYSEDMAWYGAHVYRTLHRLAAGDEALSTRLGEDGRLEVIEDGARLVWFKLDGLGMPYAFGFRDDPGMTISGPWEFQAGALKHPIWVSSADGTWRANAKSVVAGTSFDEALFSAPPGMGGPKPVAPLPEGAPSLWIPGLTHG